MKTGIVTVSTITFSIVVAILLAATSTCLIGCGGDDDIVAVEEEEEVTKEEPSGPTPPPVLPVATDEDHLNRARDTVKKVTKMEVDLVEEIRREGKSDAELFKARDALYEKEYGFDVEFVFTLREIHIEENPEEGNLNSNILTSLVLEYLQLSFKFPNLLREGLLKKIRESSRKGNISINPNNPKPVLNPEDEEDED